LKTKKA